MRPFDLYPDRGRRLLGVVTGSNARHEYGLKLMVQTGQRDCAYCGTNLTASYEIWLTLVLDHAVPLSVCKRAHIPNEWCWDYSNTVLACAACNGFCNRYSPGFDIIKPVTLEAFYDIRDKIFDERRSLIRARHAQERAFFEEKLWEASRQ